MNIRLASIEDKEGWDNYVDSRLDAVPYCRFAWKMAVEEAYGHKAYYLIAEEAGSIKGIFPFFYFHVPFCSKSFISLPFCDVGDVLAEGLEIKKALIKEALKLAEKAKIKVVEIRSCRKELLANESFGRDVNIQTSKVRMLLKLPNSSEELWYSFKSKLRSQINKAEKNDLIFAWGTIKDLDPFYDVFSRNMRDLGSPVHSKKWVEKIIEHFGENGRMGLVLKDEKPVGCGIVLFTKHTVSIPWASTLREFNRLSPNMLLYWNLLKFAVDNNKKIFDFGRSTLNEGTYRFKKQWGATPQPLFWHKIVLAGEALQSKRSSDTGTKSKGQILVNTWAKMPLSIANFLGPEIRKYISL